MTTSIEIEAANHAMDEIAMGSKGPHRRDKELRDIWVPLSIALGRQAIPSALYWKANRLGENFVGCTTDSPPRLVVRGGDPRGAWRSFIVLPHVTDGMPRIIKAIWHIWMFIKGAIVCVIGVSVSLVFLAACAYAATFVLLTLWRAIF